MVHSHIFMRGALVFIGVQNIASRSPERHTCGRRTMRRTPLEAIVLWRLTCHVHATLSWTTLA